MLEDARTRPDDAERSQRAQAARGDDDQLAGLDGAQEGRADDIERNGLRREDIGVAQPSEHQRPDAERVAAGDHPLAGQAQQAVRALDLLQRVDELVEQGAVGAGGDEVDDDLGVAGRLEDAAAPDQLAAQLDGVRDVAVVRDREAARGELGVQRLDIPERRLASRRIAVVADGDVARQRANDLLAVEIARDMPHRAVGMEGAAVEGGDPRRLLAAVLQRVQAERDQRGGTVIAVDADNAALLVQFVVIEWVGGEHGVHRKPVSLAAVATRI